MHIYLDHPDLKPETPADSNLKHRALTDFQLIHNHLYQNPDKIHQEPRYAVPESEAFDLIINKYLKLLYTGCNKTWVSIQ
jgi:hypothetical protein